MPIIIRSGNMIVNLIEVEKPTAKMYKPNKQQINKSQPNLCTTLQTIKPNLREKKMYTIWLVLRMDFLVINFRISTHAAEAAAATIYNCFK